MIPNEEMPLEISREVLPDGTHVLKLRRVLNINEVLGFVLPASAPLISTMLNNQIAQAMQAELQAHGVDDNDFDKQLLTTMVVPPKGDEMPKVEFWGELHYTPGGSDG